MENRIFIDEIRKGAKRNADAYIEAFRRNETQVIDLFSGSSGINSEIYLHGPKNYLDIVKFSSLFSDKVSLFTLHTKENGSDYHIQFPTGEDQKWKIELTAPDTSEWNRNRNSINAGYLYWNSSNTKKIFQELDSLIRSSRVIVRPMRVVTKPADHPSSQHSVHYVNPNTSTDNWVVLNGMPINSIPIFRSTGEEGRGRKLFDLTLPYIKNTSVFDFEKILREEEDLVRGFRANLRELINEGRAINGKIPEIKADLVDPEIDKLNRKFKLISGNHKRIVQTSVGFFTLSLVALTWIEFISELIDTIGISSSVLAMLYSDIEFKKGMDELRDNPYFLLWRLERNPRI